MFADRYGQSEHSAIPKKESVNSASPFIPADSISDKDGPASSYLDMVKHNTDVIAAALSKVGDAKVDSEQEDTNVSYWYLLVLLVPVVIFFIYRMVKSSI